MQIHAKTRVPRKERAEKKLQLRIKIAVLTCDGLVAMEAVIGLAEMGRESAEEGRRWRGN